MNTSHHNRRTARIVAMLLPAIVASLLAAPAFGQRARKPGANQTTFATPDEALAALKAAVAASDKPTVMKLFGPAGSEISSDDATADKGTYERFSKRLQKMSNLVKEDDSTVTLYLGAENWPFPFPIVRAGSRWYFDGEAGRREIFNRRIGANELYMIRVCRQFVPVQEEYKSQDRDGDGVLEYAQRVNSSPGARDGLYWDSSRGDDSPIGPFIANASTDGYAFKSEPQPFHGYYLRILKRQGPRAAGGTKNYVVGGNMVGGFALLAYPATWGETGLETFVVNQDGQVYQKDLGANTAAIAGRMQVFNPDSSWSLADDE